jgi:hypothetical protein
MFLVALEGEMVTVETPGLPTVTVVGDEATPKRFDVICVVPKEWQVTTPVVESIDATLGLELENVRPSDDPLFVRPSR